MSRVLVRTVHCWFFLILLLLLEVNLPCMFALVFHWIQLVLGFSGHSPIPKGQRRLFLYKRVDTKKLNRQFYHCHVNESYESPATHEDIGVTSSNTIIQVVTKNGVNWQMGAISIKTSMFYPLCHRLSKLSSELFFPRCHSLNFNFVEKDLCWRKFVCLCRRLFLPLRYEFCNEMAFCKTQGHRSDRALAEDWSLASISNSNARPIFQPKPSLFS